MSNDPKKIDAGAIRIVMKRAAMTSDEQKEFLEDLARVCGVPVEEIGEYSFSVSRDEGTSPEPR